MKEKVIGIVRYIFRGWDKEDYNTHPGLKILPPFFYELLGYSIALGLLIQLSLYLFKDN
jgi:hypothetical protein